MKLKKTKPQPPVQDPLLETIDTLLKKTKARGVTFEILKGRQVLKIEFHFSKHRKPPFPDVHYIGLNMLNRISFLSVAIQSRELRNEEHKT